MSEPKQIFLGTLGFTLVKSRMTMGLSLEDAAKWGGCDVEYLKELEAGTVKFPRPDVLYYLAEVYRVDYKVLMIEAGHLVRKDLQKTIQPHGCLTDEPKNK